MDIHFYIFGTPNTFDMYEGIGTTDDISYFLNYDDSSKENSKLTAHRRNNGQVVYSYLRYNLITNGGRRGAFLGISAIFNKLYCADDASLYDFFEQVYETILQQGILLKPENGQTVFAVRSFKEAENEINRITSILQKNLTTVFADDFKPLDDSFKWGINMDKVRQLNDKAENAAILEAFKEYPMISISPEFSDGVERIVSENLFNELKFKVAKIEKEINKLKIEIQQISNIFSSKIISPAPPITIIDENKKTLTKDNSDEKFSASKQFLHKRLLKGIVIAALVVIVIGVGFIPVLKIISTFTLPLETETSSNERVENYYDKLVKEGDTFLLNGDFDRAIEKYERAGKQDLVDIAKSKAIDYWNNKAADIKITPEESIKYLEKTRKYGATPDNFITEYQNKIGDAKAAKEKKKKDAEAEKKKGGGVEENNNKIKHRYDGEDTKHLWTVAELLTKMKNSAEGGGWRVVKDAANAIINAQKQQPDIATKEQLDRAKQYLHQANTNL